METYEMIREIFNSCDNNQMRDIFFSEIETDDIESIIKPYLAGEDVKLDKNTAGDSVTYDITSGNMKQRITFTKL